MISLNTLTNPTRPQKNRRRVGRGLGSKLGKTSGRGQKGAGARAGYKRRYGKEGGQMPLFMKLPIRGFSNARFRREYDIVNLGQINAVFEDGDLVNTESLRARGFISGQSNGVKILANGDITKKLTIRLQAFSSEARKKLVEANIDFDVESNSL